MFKQLKQFSASRVATLFRVATLSPFAPQKCVKAAHFRGAKGDIKQTLIAILIAMAMSLLVFQKEAMAQVKAPTDLPKLPTREIRVPFDDLPVLLGGKNERMFMTRAEYDDLLKKANVTPEQIAIARQVQLDESKIPTNVVMLDALNAVTVETGRASIQSDLTIEILKPGLQTVHLTLQHVGLLEALLNDKPAMLSPSLDANLPGATLFLEGKGQHRLRLKMVAAVSTSAAQQTLTIALPHAAANKWTMKVPGNVEILSGAHVRSRKVDSHANLTEFEWIPNRAGAANLQSPFSLVMTLNNKMLRDTRALEAKSILLTEITDAYEQVTQRVMINVLNGAENRFQIVIPNDFEVRKVQSPLLSRWNTLAKPQPDNPSERVLEIELREPVSDQVVFDIVASKPSKGNYAEQPVDWSWPVWRVLEAESQTAILAISLENGLRMQSIESGNLILLDVGVLDTAIPAEMRVREPTAPNVRPIATLYAPDASQSVTGQITKPKATSKTALNTLAIVSESGIRARALIAFESGIESVANFEVSLPTLWRLQTAKLLDGTTLPFEVLKEEGAVTSTAEQTVPTRTRVRLVRPFAPKTMTQIVLECTAVPKGWLSEWSEQAFAFPAISIVGTEIGTGVLSAMGEGDFTLEVSKVENLIALFESERIALKIQGNGSGPSFSAQGSNWSLELLAKRNKPQLTAEVFSFFKIESEGIKTAYELHLEIKQAATDSFQFSLPDSTPQELTIRGLDGVVVKESTSRLEDGNRIWTIKLANRVSGAAKLQVEFLKLLETDVDLSLPIARVSETTYQTGVIALEGDDELEVKVLQHPRVADVGELTESSYAVGNRLLGVFGYSVGDQGGDSVSVRATRRELQSVPNTIVERAQLSTALSAHGASHHVAELRVRTTGGFIQAKLPSDAVLWSVIVDGLPSLPQRSDGQLLIELRSSSKVSQPYSELRGGDPNLHVLRIAYETPIRSIGMRSDIDLVAPLLATMQTSTSPSTPIPTADMEWQIWVPDQLRIMDSKGDLQLLGNEARLGFPYNVFSTFASTLRVPLAIELRGGTSSVVDNPMYLESTRTSATLSTQSASSSIRTDQQVQVLVEQYNALISSSRFAEAEAVSKQVQLIRPNSEIASVLYQKAKIQSRVEPQELSKALSEDRFHTHFNSIEAASVPAMSDVNRLRMPQTSGTAQPPLPQKPAAPNTSPMTAEPQIDDLFATPTPQRGFDQPPQFSTAGRVNANDFDGFARQKSLEGLRTLPILFEGPTTWHSFQLIGFGDDPNIRLSVVNNSRLRWIAYALAAFIVTLGLALLGRPMGLVVRWTLAVMAFSVALPLLSPWPIETGILASGCFYASLAVLIARLLFGIVQLAGIGLHRPRVVGNGLLAFFVSTILVMGVTSRAQAQEVPVGKDVRNLDELIAVMRLHATTGHGPIEIPADAILVPYQLDSPVTGGGLDKILVPYAIYTQLMNLANPDKADKKPIEPPVDYSLSNLVYEATLDRDDMLVVNLQLDITTHTERRILVPFGFQGAVLTSAKLNNESASVSSGPNGLVLVMQGAGTQSFSAAFQIPIQRQGGWRIVNATLPSAQSGKMKLSVPSANTEVRLIGLPDAEQRETAQANEVIETSVATDGKLSLQWRPKVSESVADQGLSVDAECSLAIEEQGLHTVWDVKLDFRRGRRDQFEFELPKDLVVERVTGKNIRGWSIDTKNEKQIVEVTLLKSAVESERLSIIASRPMRLGAAEEATAIAPQLQMPEAMLQRGRITIYRSTLLDLEIADSSGLIREDLRADAPPFASNSPVPLKMFQSYRYGSPEYQLKIKVREIGNKLKSQTETVLRVSRNDSRLQSRLNLAVGSRPLYRVKIEVPADWQWDAPQSGVPMEWTLSAPKDGSRLFDILFLNGRSGSIAIRLSASQNRSSDIQSNEYTLDLPRIKVLDAASDQGEVHVYTDVGVDVRPEQLVGCELASGRTVAIVPNPAVQGAVLEGGAWPGPVQATSAPALGTPQAIIRYLTGDYKGLFRFQSRVPQITAMSISNVKVTRRSLEETIYMEWEIKEAGVHRFEFTLPARLKDAVVVAQMVRNIQRIPSTDPSDAPLKFIIELQEDVMGQYRILVQKDSSLPSGLHTVPIPSILTGLVQNRFVTLENSGRDELVVDSLKGVTQMVRGDSQWVKLQSLLGGKSAEVYRVDERPATPANAEPATATATANEPSMAFKAQIRSIVETASARIGLAQCVISVDEASNYRATQEFRIENTSEAYLELEMPAGAQLWTAMVASTPVKPIQSSNKPTRSGSSRLRLPLVRTQTGDLDYGVELKYAGKLKKGGFMTKLDFPLIESININVELSQVKLLLPENQHWYGFDGTLGQVRDESEFLAGWLSHKNKQIGRLSELTTKSTELFSKARAEENLKQLDSVVKFELGNSKFHLKSNPNLEQQVLLNAFVSNEAKQQVEKSESEAGQKVVRDNRDFFNGLVDSQTNYRANGNVPWTTQIDSGLIVMDAESKPADKPSSVPQVQGVTTLRSSAVGDSKDNKELASRYKNKLQGQSGSMQNAQGFDNNSNPYGSNNGPGQGGHGGQVGSGGPGGMGDMGMGGMGTGEMAGGYGGGLPRNRTGGPSSGALGGQTGKDVRSDFGLSPAFGAPVSELAKSASEKKNKEAQTYEVLEGRINDAISPNAWQSTSGTSSMREFRQNLSLAATAAQETDQAYMTSLSITLPARGKEFYFTTPRGEAKLSANGISKTVTQRAVGVMVLLLGIVLVAARRKSRRSARLLAKVL